MEKNLKDLIQSFLEHIEIEKGRSQKTAENYHLYLKRFLNFLEKDRENPSPKDITPETVHKYRLFLNRFKDGKGETLSKKTQNYHIVGLRAFLKYLARQDIETMPAEKVDLPKVDDREITVLDDEELERLLNAPDQKNLKGLRDKAILETLFSTGLRVSELADLNKDDINLKQKEFTVKGKGGKTRLVFLSDNAKKAIENYLKKRKKERKDQDPSLFIRLDAKSKDKKENISLSVRSIQRIVEKQAKKAGITKKVTAHTLRHCLATDLLMSGADIRSVQAILGHSSVTTTQIYTHVTNKQLKDVHRAFHGKRRKQKDANKKERKEEKGEEKNKNKKRKRENGK